MSSHNVSNKRNRAIVRNVRPATPRSGQFKSMGSSNHDRLARIAVSVFSSVPFVVTAAACGYLYRSHKDLFAHLPQSFVANNKPFFTKLEEHKEIYFGVLVLLPAVFAVNSKHRIHAAIAVVISVVTFPDLPVVNSIIVAVCMTLISRVTDYHSRLLSLCVLVAALLLKV